MGYALGLLLLVCLSTSSLAEFSPTQVQADYDEDDYIRWQLFVNCEPINLEIEMKSAEAHRLGWTKSYLHKTVKTSLHEVGIYTDDFTPSHVEVIVRDREFGSMQVSVSFMKMMWDPITKLPGPAVTWDFDMNFPPGQPRRHVGSTVSLALDKFIAAYFRANKVACRGNEG